MTAETSSSSEQVGPPVRGGTSSPSSSQAADAQAMQRLARGEIGALGEIYDRHHEAVRRFLVRASGNASDADDLVHATFLTLVKIAASFDEERSCRAWLFGIAARMMRRHHTARGRFLRAISRFSDERSGGSVHPEGVLMARAALDQVQRGLYRMSEPKRIVLVMAELEGMSCEEIATALEIPIGTVWRRLHDARHELLAVVAAKGDA